MTILQKLFRLRPKQEETEDDTDKKIHRTHDGEFEFGITKQGSLYVIRRSKQDGEGKLTTTEFIVDNEKCEKSYESTKVECYQGTVAWYDSNGERVTFEENGNIRGPIRHKIYTDFKKDAKEVYMRAVQYAKEGGEISEEDRTYWKCFMGDLLDKKRIIEKIINPALAGKEYVVGTARIKTGRYVGEVISTKGGAQKKIDPKIAEVLAHDSEFIKEQNVVRQSYTVAELSIGCVQHSIQERN